MKCLRANDDDEGDSRGDGVALPRKMISLCVLAGCVCVCVPSANLILFTVASALSLFHSPSLAQSIPVSFAVHNCKENVIKDFLLYNKKAHQRHTKTPYGGGYQSGEGAGSVTGALE